MPVDEGAPQLALVIRLDVKGSTLDESPVAVVDLTVMCRDVTTGE